MFTKNFRCALVVCFLHLTSMPAMAQTLPAWKLTKGQVFEVERITTQQQTVETKGKQFKHDRRSTWHVRLEVQEVLADRSRIRAVLSKVEHEWSGGAATEVIDPKLAEKMQGSSFTLSVTPQGQLREWSGYDEFVQKLSQNDKARLKALRITFPEETLREAFADLFGPLPDKKVARGDSWQRSYVEPIPHFGSLRMMVRYVYEGRTNDQDRIDYTIQSKYELPRNELMVLFRIVKGSIQSEKAHGTLTFDSVAGHLATHERSMRLRGSLTIESMDRQQSLEFISVNELKIRIKAGKKSER
jgi:hypothetical protein